MGDQPITISPLTGPTTNPTSSPTTSPPPRVFRPADDKLWNLLFPPFRGINPPNKGNDGRQNDNNKPAPNLGPAQQPSLFPAPGNMNGMG